MIDLLDLHKFFILKHLKSGDIAVDFTLLSMKRTLADPSYRTYGVNFEQILGDYAKAL